jgi:hypothetical protein
MSQNLSESEDTLRDSLRIEVFEWLVDQSYGDNGSDTIRDRDEAPGARVLSGGGGGV